MTLVKGFLFLFACLFSVCVLAHEPQMNAESENNVAKFSTIKNVNQAKESLTENSTKTATLSRVKYLADDGLMLSAQFYQGKENKPGVFLLHDCEHNSNNYRVLMSRFLQQGFAVFAPDLRGYGESIAEHFSHAVIKTMIKDIASYKNEVARINAYWDKDVITGYNYFRSKINKLTKVSVISSGCSAAQAVSLAEKMRINSFVMFTPKLNYLQKERFKNLIDMPIYFIDSQYDTDSHLTTQELFEWNGDRFSTYQTFKGIKQGHSLLNSKPFLPTTLSLWIEQVLRY